MVWPTKKITSKTEASLPEDEEAKAANGQDQKSHHRLVTVPDFKSTLAAARQPPTASDQVLTTSPQPLTTKDQARTPAEINDIEANKQQKDDESRDEERRQRLSDGQ